MADEIRRIAALLEQSLSEKDQDLISFIKQKNATELKKVTSYTPEKVVTRSDTKRVSLPPSDDQGKNYCERRQALLSTGFFCPANRYATIAQPFNCTTPLFHCSPDTQ